MLRQIVLDTETTGLEPEKGHRIIEIGCLELINRRLTNNNFHVYINPERVVERGAEEVHGITNEFLADKPLFVDIASEFIRFVSGAELIIHNAPFDVGFLDHEFKRLGKRFKSIRHYCQVLDTLALARAKHPGQHNSLDALCKRYHVNNANRQLHGALLDAELLAQVYLLMTGGQTLLFQSTEKANNASQHVSEHRKLSADRPPLPVIKPSSEEWYAHQQFVDKLLLPVS